MNQCEGACDKRFHEGHRGSVKKVTVAGIYRPFNTPTEYNYCDQAIEDDRKSGFTVEILGDIDGN
jgi:hypothetical protein